MWTWGMGPPLWGLIGILVWLVVWIAIIWFAVSLLRGDIERHPRRRTPPALAILEERYARGEVSREEFLERRAVLLGHPGAPPPAPPPPGA